MEKYSIDETFTASANESMKVIEEAGLKKKCLDMKKKSVVLTLKFQICINR
ncbi:hypothetical protein [Alkalibacter mobilis]|uniref:hypothetical protein n=1 Tax=Alkalibacter mobilis TaxID=2787712 RepID=UPI00189FE295|nr:hypothetical protein [Alkalibacter mobilis]